MIGTKKLKYKSEINFEKRMEIQTEIYKSLDKITKYPDTNVKLEVINVITKCGVTRDQVQREYDLIVDKIKIEQELI